MREIISIELLSEVLEINCEKIELEADNIFFIKNNGAYINIHELAFMIVDKIVSLKYVAMLTKIKDYWWLDFATEHYYKINGDTNYGSEDYNVNTKSNTPLEACVKALEFILKKEKDAS